MFRYIAIPFIYNNVIIPVISFDNMEYDVIESFPFIKCVRKRDFSSPQNNKILNRET